MADQPDYYAEHTTPLQQDTRLRVWTKVLGHYQNLPGADPANNPEKQDTLRIIRQKTLKAVNG